MTSSKSRREANFDTDLIIGIRPATFEYIMDNMDKNKEVEEEEEEEKKMEGGGGEDEQLVRLGREIVARYGDKAPSGDLKFFGESSAAVHVQHMFLRHFSKRQNWNSGRNKRVGRFSGKRRFFNGKYWK